MLLQVQSAHLFSDMSIVPDMIGLNLDLDRKQDMVNLMYRVDTIDLFLKVRP